MNKVIWISVKDRLPDKNTAYAGSYGVSTLVFDQVEHDIAGYHPTYHLFDFERKGWYEYCDALDDGVNKFPWLPIEVTHWAELPEIPKQIKIPQ